MNPTSSDPNTASRATSDSPPFRRHRGVARRYRLRAEAVQRPILCRSRRHVSFPTSDSPSFPTSEPKPRNVPPSILPQIIKPTQSKFTRSSSPTPTWRLLPQPAHLPQFSEFTRSSSPTPTTTQILATPKPRPLRAQIRPTLSPAHQAQTKLLFLRPRRRTLTPASAHLDLPAFYESVMTNMEASSSLPRSRRTYPSTRRAVHGASVPRRTSLSLLPLCLMQGFDDASVPRRTSLSPDRGSAEEGSFAEERVFVEEGGGFCEVRGFVEERLFAGVSPRGGEFGETNLAGVGGVRLRRVSGFVEAQCLDLWCWGLVGLTVFVGDGC